MTKLPFNKRFVGLVKVDVNPNSADPTQGSTTNTPKEDVNLREDNLDNSNQNNNSNDKPKPKKSNTMGIVLVALAVGLVAYAAID